MTTDASARPPSAAAPRQGGAIPGLGGTPGRHMALHAAAAVALLAFLDWLIATHAPFGVEQIGSSYLIAYYHVPSAILMGVAYAWVFVAGILHLITRSMDWDRRARAGVAVGLLANAVVLATGSVWGKAAWNTWWDMRDPRLTTSAIILLIYVAYFVLARGIEEETRRARVCAVYGILALLAYMPVKFAVEWFGQGSHPPEVSMPDPRIQDTRNAGILAFAALYLLVYRWTYDLEALRDRKESALARIRRLEDSRS